MVLYNEALVELLEIGREERFLEFKQSSPWEDLKHKIAKSVLAMSNIRDGGKIIIGVEETGNGFDLVGMCNEHLETFKSDDVQDFVNRYADPYVTLRLQTFLHGSNKFLAIVVGEFESSPIICKKSGPENLCKGSIYARPHGKPQSCPVQSQSEMREIIDMAIEKSVRRFVETADRAGIVIPIGAKDTDRESYEQQLDGL